MREEEGSPAAKKIHIKVKRGKTGPGWLVRGARRRGTGMPGKRKVEEENERASEREARREFARVLFLLPCSGSALTFSPPFGFPIRPSIPPEPAGSYLASNPQTAASRSRRAPSTPSDASSQLRRAARKTSPLGYVRSRVRILLVASSWSLLHSRASVTASQNPATIHERVYQTRGSAFQLPSGLISVRSRESTEWRTLTKLRETLANYSPDRLMVQRVRRVRSALIFTSVRDPSDQRTRQARRR